MLVTFTCDAYPDTTLFGDVALRLLKMMGHSGTVPGALMPEDIPAALERLKQAVAAEKAAAAASKEARTRDRSDSEPDDDSDTPTVDIALRAFPLIELLTAAAREECHVMWQSSGR